MTVQQLIERLGQISCLTPSKKGILLNAVGTADLETPTIFYVRGTRLAIKVIPVTKYDKTSGYFFTEPNLTWSIKQKKRKKYQPISFEDVLDLDFIGDKAKTELLFHLDLFARKENAS